MRFLCAAICAACFAFAAQAKTLAEFSDERACAEDSECVVIEGVCGPTAVNKAYENNAKEYYKKQAKGKTCPTRFWEVKERVAECKPLAGSKATKDAPIQAHGTCRAVAKPQENKK